MSKLLVDGTYAINIVKLKEIAEKKTTKNIYGLVTETFTNSAENGIISQSDFFDRTITNDKNISGYFIVEPDDFVYNPRISTFAPVGPINRNKLGRSGVMSPLYLVFHTHDVEPEYLEWYFKSNAWHQFMRDNGNTGARSDRFSISDAEFFNMPIPIPPVKVQKAIAKTLTTLDTKVILEKNEVEKFQNLKSAMLTKMFPKKDGNVPEIRFDGFTDVWEQRKFSDITFPAGEKNRDNLPLESYSITNEHGFIPQDEKFENGGTMREADKRMYYIVSPNSFAYNPARINVGSIGYQNTGKDVIVSSLYEVFKTSDDVDDRLLWHWFKSPDFQKLIFQLQEGGVRLYFYYDKLCMGTVSLPSLEEQRKIGQLFDSLDTLITLHQRKYEKLIDTKKAFLEKLIGGEK